MDPAHSDSGARSAGGGKVLLVTRWYLPSVGGVQTVVHKVASQLAASGFQVRVLAHAEQDALTRDDAGFTVRLIGEVRLAGKHLPGLSWYLTQRKVARLLDSEPRDVAACHVFDASFGHAAVHWARRRGIASVVSITGHEVHGTGRNRLRDMIIGRTLKAAGRVTSPSRHLADLARGRLGAERIEIVPHGISLAQPDKGEAAALRHGLGIGDSAFVFGCIQRLYAGKTPFTALDAFRRLASERADIHLLVVGDGPDKDAFEAAVQEAGLSRQVSLAAAVHPARVPVCLGACDVFVLDSRYETFALGVLEAMAAGLPVIATAVGAVPELVADGDTGLLVASSDARAMARAMARLVEDPDLRRGLSAAAKAHAAGFDWRAITDRYAAYYRAPSGD